MSQQLSLERLTFTAKGQAISTGLLQRDAEYFTRFAGSEWFIASQHMREAIMKAAIIVGILLIVLGIIGFAVGGISFTHQKKDVDVGPVQLSHNETSTMPISPILSTLSLIVGAGLVVVAVRTR